MDQQTAFNITAACVGFVSACWLSLGAAFARPTAIALAADPVWDSAEVDAKALAVKTEKHEWREALHCEEDILNGVMGKLNVDPDVAAYLRLIGGLATALILNESVHSNGSAHFHFRDHDEFAQLVRVTYWNGRPWNSLRG